MPINFEPRQYIQVDFNPGPKEVKIYYVDKVLAPQHRRALETLTDINAAIQANATLTNETGHSIQDIANAVFNKYSESYYATSNFLQRIWDKIKKLFKIESEYDRVWNLWQKINPDNYEANQVADGAINQKIYAAISPESSISKFFADNPIRLPPESKNFLLDHNEFYVFLGKFESKEDRIAFIRKFLTAFQIPKPPEGQRSHWIHFFNFIKEVPSEQQLKLLDDIITLREKGLSLERLDRLYCSLNKDKLPEYLSASVTFFSKDILKHFKPADWFWYLPFKNDSSLDPKKEIKAFAITLQLLTNGWPIDHKAANTLQEALHKISTPEAMESCLTRLLELEQTWPKENGILRFPAALLLINTWSHIPVDQLDDILSCANQLYPPSSLLFKNSKPLDGYCQVIETLIACEPEKRKTYTKVVSYYLKLFETNNHYKAWKLCPALLRLFSSGKTNEGKAYAEITDPLKLEQTIEKELLSLATLNSFTDNQLLHERMLILSAIAEMAPEQSQQKLMPLLAQAIFGEPKGYAFAHLVNLNEIKNLKAILISAQNILPAFTLMAKDEKEVFLNQVKFLLDPSGLNPLHSRMKLFEALIAVDRAERDKVIKHLIFLFGSINTGTSALSSDDLINNFSSMRNKVFIGSRNEPAYQSDNFSKLISIFSPMPDNEILDCIIAASTILKDKYLDGEDARWLLTGAIAKIPRQHRKEVAETLFTQMESGSLKEWMAAFYWMDLFIKKQGGSLDDWMTELCNGTDITFINNSGLRLQQAITLILKVLKIKPLAEERKDFEWLTA